MTIQISRVYFDFKSKSERRDACIIAAEIQNRIRQMNPWMTYPDQAGACISRLLPPVYVDRAAEKTAVSDQRANLIVGCRQSGKSTMIWHRIGGFAPNVLFLNMEDPLLRSGLASPVELAELARKDYTFVEALFKANAESAWNIP